MIGGAQNVADAVYRVGVPLGKLTVDVTVIAATHAVFREHVHKLPTAEIAKDGREMQKGNDLALVACQRELLRLDLAGGL